MEYADNAKELVHLNEGGCSSREAVHWTNNDCQWFTESAFVDGCVSTFIFVHLYFGFCPFVFSLQLIICIFSAKPIATAS